MSGLDLCTMLKSQRPEAVIYMLADDYDEADERAAYIRGAALFSCKPAQPALFEDLHRWLGRARSACQPRPPATSPATNRYIHGTAHNNESDTFVRRHRVNQLY